MAIDESMINQYGDQLESTIDIEALESLRNCPTPRIHEDIFGEDLISSFDLQDLAPYGMDLMAEGNSIESNTFQTIAMTSQMSAITPQNGIQPNYIDMPSTSFINQTQLSTYPNEATITTFTSFDTNPFEFDNEDSKTVILDGNISADTMSRKATYKEKCMTKNAVLARQNREKKKSEQHSLLKKVKDLQEENAILKKKNKELADAHANVLNRNTYMEAIIQNLPQIMNMVDHMNKFPGPSGGSGGGGGKVTNSSKKT